MAAKKDKKDKGSRKERASVEVIDKNERFDFSFTQNRELSWLRFDARVLDEAYPALAKAVRVTLPDEGTRRVGQSIAAASLPRR